jgi:alanine-glyoxylate transaminase / serine-glyoxylate transaminase / serine-pyruvate transaminase
MSDMLASGRPYLAIPGPSVMPDAVLNAMHRAAPNIYTGELIEMTAGLIPDLKAVARTAHNATIYIGNGHAAWEASLANVLSRGDLVLVPATGRFGLGWAEMARGLGAEVEVIDFGPESAWDLGRIEERLAGDPEGRIKAVLAVHVDTSSSVKNDVAGLRAVLDRVGHPALLMADCIASLGCDRFEMDAWGADVMVAASQKGLMVPPGMCFVFFNDRADAARERANCVTRYWDWRPRANPQEYWEYFDGTAPTHHLYGLRVALDMITAEGIENVWRRHEVLAQAIWAAFDAWSVRGPVRLNVADPALRSWAVTSAHAGSPDAARLRDWCERVAGLTLGIGLGRAPADAWFRIGHMGHVSAPMVLGALGTIEAGLAALQIPHGAGGVAAAAEVVARA